MSILKGIKLKDDSTVHQLDYEQGIANKPKIVKSWNDLEDKPFHDDLDAREIIVEKTTLTMSLNNDKYYISNPEPILKGLRFVENDKFIYIWDDVEYECTTKYEVDEQGIGFYSIGNSKVNKADGEDTGEPFFIACLVSSDKTSKVYNVVSINEVGTVEVQKAYKTVQTIDGKYVKDMYYCEEGLNEILPLQDVEFGYASEGYSYVCPLTYYDIPIGDTIDVKWNGTDYACEVGDMGALLGDSLVVPVIGNVDLMLGGEGNGIPFVIVFDITGELSGMGSVISIMEMETEPNEEVQTITKQLGIYHKATKINQIPPKYIKEMYYTEDDEKLLVSQDVNTVADTGGYNLDRTSCSLALQLGATYKVVFEGTEYLCDVQLAEGFMWIGNWTLLDNGDDFDTGEPFGYAYTPMECCFGTKEAGVFHVEIYQGEKVHQIPSKYVDAYTKEEIDAMFGAYVNEVDTLLGGNE